MLCGFCLCSNGFQPIAISAKLFFKFFLDLPEVLDMAENISPLEPFKTYDLPTPYDNFGTGAILMETHRKYRQSDIINQSRRKILAMLKYLNISEIPNKLPQLVEDKNSEPAIIIKEGKPVIIAFNIEQFDALLETLEIMADQELMTDIKEGIRQLEKGETITLEELEVELGLIED